MKIIFILLITISALFSKLNVAVAYPYIGDITKKIAKNRVNIIYLSKGNWDPHFVVPKPSLISSLRDADILIINGASLEAGWLSPIVNGANNSKIARNSNGYLELSNYIKLQDVPRRVDRSMGHIHAEGNPHFILDPHNVIKIAKVIALKLSIQDNANKSFYMSNYNKFKSYWNSKLKGYDKRMKKCKGMRVVEYHELFNYFLRRYGITSIDNLEPLPGVKPNPKHTIKVIKDIKQNGVKLILQDVYHEHKTAKFIANKSGAKVAVLPHDIGAIRGVNSLEKFYNTLVSRVCR
ncbi:Zinc ABC transporter, periplasmic-binding protein ZnuA [hydrothermal vent metagenome]|uniref:Zinc ABC transporter, periplasmic-binding protein ZnuA n=1 Tax=hydrothermal vent metagenome TaxID=652676 RepID=A0A1W1EKI2_9ZZZZ